MTRREELDRKILAYMFRCGHAPRTELVAYTGIRAATVFESVDRLKASGLLIEPSRRGKKTGRTSPELKSNPDFASWIGIDLNTQKTLAVRTDNNGQILDSAEVPAGKRLSAVDVFAEIFQVIETLQQNAGKEWFKVCGIGFSDPGTIDMRRGRSLSAVNIPGWHNVDTVKTIEEKTGLMCTLWSDGMILAKGEYMARQEEPPEKLIHLALGQTIGAGFVDNGSIYCGSSGKAMEIGHLVIHDQGPLCRCGSRGCLEAVAAIPALLKTLEKLKKEGVATQLESENFSVEKWAALSDTDPGAQSLLSTLTEALGKALIPVVTLLDPDLIVLSGELALLGEKLRLPLLGILKNGCLSGAAETLKIEFAQHACSTTARGAALLMRDRVILSQLV